MLLLKNQIFRNNIIKTGIIEILYSMSLYYEKFWVILHPKRVYMKKSVFILLAGLFLFPSRSLASSRTYQIINTTTSIPVIKHGPNGGPIIAKMPAHSPIILNVNEDSGELYIVFNSSIPSMHICFSQNGETIDEDFVDVTVGQTMIYNLSSYEEGQYTLTIESEGNILSQYEITIYDE